MEKMKHYYLGWKQSLSELNDFSSQLEFLHSKIRNHVAISNVLDIDKYLTSVKKLVSKHEQNLYNITNETKSEIIRGYGGERKFKFERKTSASNIAFH